MYAVIFEVEPTGDGRGTYLEIAGELRNDLEKTDGFISIERFQSLSNEKKILSLSFWRDEESLIAWREQSDHIAAQRLGRERLFEDYRIRVVEVVRDYGMTDRSEAPRRGLFE